MNRLHRDSHEPVTGLGAKVDRQAKPKQNPIIGAPEWKAETRNGVRKKRHVMYEHARLGT